MIFYAHSNKYHSKANYYMYSPYFWIQLGWRTVLGKRSELISTVGNFNAMAKSKEWISFPVQSLGKWPVSGKWQVLSGNNFGLNGNFALCHLQKICGNYAASYSKQTNKQTMGQADRLTDSRHVVNCAVVEWMWILLIVGLNELFKVKASGFSPEPAASFSYQLPTGNWP